MKNKTSDDIIRRTSLDDSLIGELLNKYPPCKTANNVIFPTKLEYLTYELELIKEPTIQTIMAEEGVGVIAVIFYLRNIMCNLGYCMKFDDVIKKQLIREMSFFLYMDASTVEAIIDKLIEKKYLFVIKDENIVEGTYLTCIQQVFNYEMYANKKKIQNINQQNHRNKNKAAAQPTSEPQVYPQDPFNLVGDAYGSPNAYPIEDPFGPSSQPLYGYSQPLY